MIMINREKRRDRIKKILRFWYKYGIAIAVGLLVLVVIVTIGILCAFIKSEPAINTEQTVAYTDIFETDENGNVKKNNKKKNTSSESGGESEEVEYSTVLQYNPDTKPGYMNNCVFLGDSRTVAMVSYGFVSDENVLAKVGIGHTAVMNSKFTQNSGKEYTVAEYLASHPAPVVYLAFGVNGMNGISEENYEKSFKEMVEAIIEKAPDSEIVIMAIGPVDDYGAYKKSVQNSWINKYNEFLKTLAEYEGIYYLDVDTVLKGEDGQVKPEYDAGDGLHYRACAYTVILDYIIHHPVIGVPDDGEFVVKYVKPTGQFKKMMKETTTLPANVQVVTETAPVSEAVKEDEIITPSPTVTMVPTISVSPSPTIKTKPAVSPSPTVIPTKEPGMTPTPTPVPTPVVAPPEPTKPTEPEVVPTPEPPGVTETPDKPEEPEEPSDGGDDKKEEVTPEARPTEPEPATEPDHNDDEGEE